MNAIVHNIDALEFLQSNAEFKFDLMFTSPPYKKKDGYDLRLFTEIFRQARYHAADGALCFVNFGHLAHHKHDPFELALSIKDTGWVWHDTIVWVKNHYTPLPNPNLNNLWEPVFLFCNGIPVLDRQAIGVPYVDKSNVSRYGGGKDLRCRGNVWHVPYETIQSSDAKTHKDRFPVELPTLGIKLSGLKSGTVYDCCAGSGTTGEAAIAAGLDFVGTDILPDIARKANERLQKLLDAKSASVAV